VGGIILVLTIACGSWPASRRRREARRGRRSNTASPACWARRWRVVLAPIGFNWQISIALVPGLAAREVAVSALGTVYALSATGDDTAQALAPLIAPGWSLATALSLLAWYVFAPQCLRRWRR
jgi:ferrous iron transport protein B